MATANSVTANLTTCPICLDLFDNPKSLPCLHAFCLKCLQGQFRNKAPGQRASCPNCRKEFQIPRDGVGGLQHHFIVQQLVDVIRQRGNSCDKHKDKEVELYCYDCKENICLTCFAGKHRNHNSDLIPEVADNFRHRINDDVQQILSAISSASKRSGMDVAKFRSKVEDVEKKVLAVGDVVKRSIDSQVNGVLMELRSVTSENAKQIESVQEAYQLALVKVEDFCADSQELLGKRPSDVTRAACELHDRATELLDNDIAAVKYRPPYVTFTFTPADVTQVKRLSLIGKLTVRREEQPEEPLPSAQCVETEEEKDDQHPKQSNDTAALLQDELTQATYRERQLQMQLDKMKDDASQLRTQLQQLSNVQKLFSDFKRRTAPIWEREMKQRDMGRVIQTLPEGEPVDGVTSLDNHLYVLRGNKSSEQIEVYDIESYLLVNCLTVPGLGAVVRDIVACRNNRCAYISDWSRNSVRRVALPDATVKRWPVNDEPAGLSLTRRHGVLVTCREVRKIKEFSTDGQLLHVLILPQDVVSPWHAVQLSSGQFVVCHGVGADPLHRVCLIGSDGSVVVKSFGGQKGSGSQCINTPAHLAVDRDEFVFVVDAGNRRVSLLSPQFAYVREVVSCEQLWRRPLRVHLDCDAERLYVAHGTFRAGRVDVVSV